MRLSTTVESSSCAEVKTTNPEEDMKGGICFKWRKSLKEFTREKEEKENCPRMAGDKTAQNGRRNGKIEERSDGEINKKQENQDYK